VTIHDVHVQPVGLRVNSSTALASEPKSAANIEGAIRRAPAGPASINVTNQPMGDVARLGPYGRSSLQSSTRPPRHCRHRCRTLGCTSSKAIAPSAPSSTTVPLTTLRVPGVPIVTSALCARRIRKRRPFTKVKARPNEPCATSVFDPWWAPRETIPSSVWPRTWRRPPERAGAQANRVRLGLPTMPSRQLAQFREKFTRVFVTD